MFRYAKPIPFDLGPRLRKKRMTWGEPVNAYLSFADVLENRYPTLADSDDSIAFRAVKMRQCYAEGVKIYFWRGGTRFRGRPSVYLS